MDNRRCSSCSEPPRRGSCQCNRMPSNLEFVQKVVNKPTKPRLPRKCLQKCFQCIVQTAGGDNIDCLCNFHETLSTTASDRRLKTWEDELKCRNSIAERLMQRTGKSACELLFNRPVTVDVRDKLMMQRLLAHAQSNKPHAAKQKKALIKEQLSNGCVIEEISSANSVSGKYFEISGIPAGVKCELIGENCCARRSGWIASRTVREQIAAKSKSIRRVVPFFPNIEFLQVIGKKMIIHKEAEDEQCADDKPCADDGTCCATPQNGGSAAVLPKNIDPATGEECQNGCTINLPISNENNFDRQGGKDNEYSICSPCSRMAVSSDDGNGKAPYEIFCCLRDKLNQKTDEDSLNASDSFSSNFDFYDELIANRAKCHNLFYGP